MLRENCDFPSAFGGRVSEALILNMKGCMMDDWHRHATNRTLTDELNAPYAIAIAFHERRSIRHYVTPLI